MLFSPSRSTTSLIKSTAAISCRQCVPFTTCFRQKRISAGCRAVFPRWTGPRLWQRQSETCDNISERDSNNRRHRLRARQTVRDCAKIYLERLYGHSYQGTHTSCDNADDSHLVFVTLAVLSNIADTVTMIACTFLAPYPFRPRLSWQFIPSNLGLVMSRRNESHHLLLIEFIYTVSRLVRHSWDLPLCWVNEEYQRVA